MAKKKETKAQLNQNKDLSYYLTMFTLEGHTTWRCHLSQKKDGFDHEWNSQQQGVKPKITARNVIHIDRLTGTIKPL